jgi:hypothetical protein
MKRTDPFLHSRADPLVHLPQVMVVTWPSGHRGWPRGSNRPNTRLNRDLRINRHRAGHGATPKHRIGFWAKLPLTNLPKCPSANGPRGQRGFAFPGTPWHSKIHCIDGPTLVVNPMQLPSMKLQRIVKENAIHSCNAFPIPSRLASPRAFSTSGSRLRTPHFRIMMATWPAGHHACPQTPVRGIARAFSTYAIAVPLEASWPPKRANPFFTPERP